MYPEARVRTQISLTDEQYVTLKAIAEERGESMSAVIREAVDRLVTGSRPDPVAALLSISGIAEGGPRDLAENHDYYLYGPDLGK